MQVTENLVLQCLPCQTPGIIGSALWPVDPLTIFCVIANLICTFCFSEAVGVIEEIRPWSTHCKLLGRLATKKQIQVVKSATLPTPLQVSATLPTHCKSQPLFPPHCKSQPLFPPHCKSQPLFPPIASLSHSSHPIASLSHSFHPIASLSHSSHPIASLSHSSHPIASQPLFPPR